MTTPNTLETLRATLTEHAAIADTEMIGRGASIHRRIQVVRRRRRAAMALGTVAAVLALVAGIALPIVLRGHGEGDFAAAPVVTVGGFEYRLVKVVEPGPGHGRVDIAAPRPGASEAFALLAAHLDGGHATLRSNNVENRDLIDQIALDGANPAVPVVTPRLCAGCRGPYRLTLSGGDSRTRVGVAVYARTAAMPAGVVDPTGTTVFRQTIGSRSLLAGAFAKPGQAEVSVRFRGRVSQTAIEGFCSKRQLATKGSWFVNVSIDGGGAVSWSECGEPAEDAADGGFISADPSIGEHTVRVWTSETSGGAAHAFPGVVLGAAAYDDSAALTINGNRVDPVVERDGRTWRLDTDATSRHHGSGHSLEASVTSDEPVLFGFASNNVTRIDATGENTLGAGGGFRSATAGASSSIGVISAAGTTSSYRLTWPAKDTHAQVSILVYRLVR